ncbi:hypothetical protein K2F40_14600 [Clostridium sp. CM028]|uniref:hypothetical protein n=1 Tax=Clostridium TaxID=1485 RepID=UPI0013EE5CC6|nr:MULTISPECIES: hypothetical protein [Clostridium]MBU3091266.1 hypothetical protein [Clostridium sp. CF011]MBW9147018.1 hypothetical protein [Clostridium sp. CM027]MBW9150190.1 hypothetical protein [Clostridium sp. CM028]MBZ9606517.1 hypothetical protein [Clostridium estertheticum]UVE39665.1 hypothetical protein KTC92_10470 [Clostridium sp. CM027]
MSEITQMFKLFCITSIAVLGITSAVVFFSKDRISFNIKARTKLPDQSETEFGIEVHKDDKKTK